MLQGGLTKGQGGMSPMAQLSTPGFSWIPQAFHQVSVVWKHLEHPNIILLLGIAINPSQLMSDQIAGGNLTEYIMSHLDTDKISFVGDLSASL